MTTETHANDRLDCIVWLIEQVRRYSPEYGKDQTNRDRMIVAEKIRRDMADEAGNA